MGNRNRRPRWRAARRREMKARGITPPNRQEMWCVQPSALVNLPDWVSRATMNGLGSYADRVWLRPGHAKRLIALDRAAGGRSQVLKVEFRHCDMCARPLLSLEAERRRELIETDPTARSLPCGPNCERDRELRLWKRMAPTCRAMRVKPKRG